MADDLLGDIERLSTFLAQQKGQIPEDTWDAMQKKHSDQLIARLRGLRVLTAQQASAISTAVAASASLFVGKEAKETLSIELSEKLAECLNPSASAKKNKRQLQEILSFRHYFTAQDLEMLGDDTMTDHDKYDRVSARMFSVGLAYPTEASFAIVFYAGIAAGIKVENAAEGLRKLNAFKKLHRKKRDSKNKDSQDPKDYIQKYPEEPDQLPDELKECYKESPRQSLAEEAVKEASEKLSGIRKSKKETQASSSQSLVPLQMGSGAGQTAADMPQNMAQALPMMAHMMQGMMQMMQNMNSGDQTGDAAGLQIFKPKQKAQPKQQLALADAAGNQSQSAQPEPPQTPGGNSSQTPGGNPPQTPGGQSENPTPDKAKEPVETPSKRAKLRMDFSPGELASMMAGEKPLNDREADEDDEEDDEGLVMKKPAMKKPATVKPKPAPKNQGKASAHGGPKKSNRSTWVQAKDGWKVETRHRPDGQTDRYYYKGDKRYRIKSEAESAGFRG